MPWYDTTYLNDFRAKVDDFLCKREDWLVKRAKLGKDDETVERYEAAYEQAGADLFALAQEIGMDDERMLVPMRDILLDAQATEPFADFDAFFSGRLW